jgi:glycosyltransferase involved in cell wall biosynthesis
MRLLHIIVDLDVGGAESMLYRLIESKPGSIHETTVISLTTLGVIGKALRARGVCVHALGMTSFWHAPIILFRLIKLIRRYRPKIVQTWMYHADFLGGLAAFFSGSCFIVWNVRSTAIPQGIFSFTFWLVRICAIFSHLIPDRIICAANSAKNAHIKLRYAAQKMTVIFNGYDFSLFKRQPNTRIKSRLQLGFDERDIVIGAIGRFDPLKDFHNFINAAAKVASNCEVAKFILVGRNNEWSNATLRGWIELVGLESKFHLLGQQTDITYFLSAMDIFCLSSVNEAFPNVVVEAMAAGLPCVVTHVGDAADILGDNGFVVPAKDPISLANALLRMHQIGPVNRRLLGERGAIKVRDEYGIEKCRNCYDAVYDEILRK